MTQKNSGVIIGGNSTIVGAVGGEGATVNAHVVQAPPREDIEAKLKQIETALAAIADTPEKRALITQDMSALRAAALAPQPDQNAFMDAAKNIHRTVVMAGGALKGVADATLGLKVLAGLFGWAAAFII